MRKAAFLLGTILMGSPALAQGQSDRLGEIVVTARKQTESLLDVPVAVTALSSETLERSGATDLSRISQLAPQVVLARGDASGAGASFSIRGLGSTWTDGGVEQSVTVNIDGIQVTRGNIVSQGFFDLEQVEILKGPQVLFFGKNSPAGVVSLRSKDPTDELEGYVRAGYEFEANERFVEGAISGPLAGGLKARLAFRASKMRGWLTYVAEPIPNNPLYPSSSLGTPGRTDRGNGGEDLIGRATLQYDDGGPFDATLKVTAGSFKDDGSVQQATCFPETAFPTALGVPDPINDCRFDRFSGNTGGPTDLIVDWPGMPASGEPFTKSNSVLASLTMNLDLGGVTLTSVSGYFDLDYRSVNNSEHTTLGALPVALGEKTKQYSQEFRAISSFDGPLNFTLGAFYEEVRRSDYVAAMLFDVGSEAVTGKYHTYENRSRNKGRTISAFGQIRVKLTDQLEAAGGVRWTKEKKNYFLINDFVHPISGPLLNLVPAGTPLPGSTNFRDDDLSPEATLTWKPSSDVMFYAAYKTGYKSGGFSRPALYQNNITGEALSFGSESAEGGEVGFKGYLADRKIRVEATAYFYDYSGLQVATFDQATFSYKIRNAAVARIKGIEISTEWKATRDLTFTGSVAYNRARFRTFLGAQCWNGQPVGSAQGQCDPATGGQNLSGRPLSRAPEWTAMAGFQYETGLTEGLRFGLNGDLNYTDEYITADDQNPTGVQEGYTLFNAGARIFSQDDQWEIALIGRNLTNKYYKYITQSKAFGGTNEFWTSTPRGREVRVQGTFRF